MMIATTKNTITKNTNTFTRESHSCVTATSKTQIIAIAKLI